MVIVAHDRGNCSAYNAGWQTALAAFPSFTHLAVIDDDEIADPCWLERMCAAAETLRRRHRRRAASAGLPARRRHARAPAHPVFARPIGRAARCDALYSSGNLLIGRNVLDAMGAPFLDLAFNFMGGGDSDFLSRAGSEGFRLGLVRRGAGLRNRAGTAASRPTGSGRAACAMA